MSSAQFLVIGGGPAGLGSAVRLTEHRGDWHLIEAEDHVGGLASSFCDDCGFTWDLGGHVLFSHYASFDRHLDRALGPDAWLTHRRKSAVWFRRRFVPYPFQHHLHRLDPGDRWRCVEGLLDIAGRRTADAPADFEEWMLSAMGPGLTDLFLRPYNRKVWAWPASRMDWNWVGERVAVPDIRRVLMSICLGEDDDDWGPNRSFRFPRRGGTGAIWRAVGEALPPSRISLRTRVARIDAGRRRLWTGDGREWDYERLISSMPLDELIRIAPGVVPPESADALLFSGTHVVGVGVRGSVPEALAAMCWMYFPEDNSPYYRVTVFSNYSPHHVPDAAPHWSLLAEVSESAHRPVEPERLVEDVLRALIEDGLLPDAAEVVSTVWRFLPHGYPTPFKGRDAAVDPILRAFERADIYSRGRFGAWKYEVSNQDHCFAQGSECVDRVMAAGGLECEPTLHTPALVNSRVNP